jgi:hypothetical protein
MGKAKAKVPAKPRARSNVRAKARCLCGSVELEIDVPAFWAWHDHSANSRRAHGAAYATYVGSYKSRFRILKGEKLVTRYTEVDTANTRNFCAQCGTPLMYERGDPKPMVNIPRALFDTRTGREPLYHIAIEQMQDWTYAGAALGPLKGYPGVVWERRKKKRAAGGDALFE